MSLNCKANESVDASEYNPRKSFFLFFLAVICTQKGTEIKNKCKKIGSLNKFHFKWISFV